MFIIIANIYKFMMFRAQDSYVHNSEIIYSDMNF